jgi:hypothetical protein
MGVVLSGPRERPLPIAAALDEGFANRHIKA